jgi:hypothetical protein
MYVRLLGTEYTFCDQDLLFREAHYLLERVVEVLSYKPEGLGFFSLWAYGVLPYFGPSVDSAHNRSEYQGCFLGVKAVDAYG